MTMQPPTVQICRADYANPVHAAALAHLLDGYARDIMGGGAALPAEVLARVAGELAKRSHAFSILAFVGGAPAGLVNCFEGFSTFACKPLLNVHDVSVQPEFRGRGIAQGMLREVEQIARERGCCKLTLEVLQGNTHAIQLYQKIGFGGYKLVDSMGHAVFFQKSLEQVPDKSHA
jgi:ribosomal protein S18 acetylase RimI-like enzyme